MRAVRERPRCVLPARDNAINSAASTHTLAPIVPESAMRSGRPLSALLQFALALVTIVGLSLAATAQTDDVSALVANLPRGFVGDFRWDDGGGAVQIVAIQFKNVRRVDAQHVEALGCGNYNIAGVVTSIDVKMQVTLPDLEVEIWESGPDRASFVTDGSHRGRISRTLDVIEAEWTTRSTGQHGHLRLQAAPAAQCAPAAAT
jgi:hypothetical protein